MPQRTATVYSIKSQEITCFSIQPASWLRRSTDLFNQRGRSLLMVCGVFCLACFFNASVILAVVPSQGTANVEAATVPIAKGIGTNATANADADNLGDDREAIEYVMPKGQAIDSEDSATFAVARALAVARKNFGVPSEYILSSEQERALQDTILLHLKTLNALRPGKAHQIPANKIAAESNDEIRTEEAYVYHMELRALFSKFGIKIIEHGIVEPLVGGKPSDVASVGTLSARSGKQTAISDSQNAVERQDDSGGRINSGVLIQRGVNALSNRYYLIGAFKLSDRQIADIGPLIIRHMDVIMRLASDPVHQAALKSGFIDRIEALKIQVRENKSFHMTVEKELTDKQIENYIQEAKTKATSRHMAKQQLPVVR
jgi:hypothetical protein